MNIDEAVKLWVERDFSKIPTDLIKKDLEKLELLSREYPELDYPACWGWMFHPICSYDERWIRNHIKEVEECEFLVYEFKEVGILLGVDGCGYDFFEDHWKPLYIARGIYWHNE